MTERICPKLVELNSLADIDLKLDPTRPGTAIAQSLMNLALKEAQSLREMVEHRCLEIDWPVGVPADVRRVLRAQIEHQLTIGACEIIMAQARALVSIAKECASLAIIQLRNEMKTRRRR